MKILHFLGIGRVPRRPMSEATGGTERSALEFARIQARRGHDVTVASMAEETWRGAWEGVKLRRLKPYSWAQFDGFGRTWDLRAHLPLAAMIHTDRFDIIHLHEYFKTRFFAARATVMHFHNNPLPDLDAAEFARAAPRFWERAGKSSAQIAVSEFVAERLRRAHRESGFAGGAHIVKVSGGVNSAAVSSQDRRDARARVRRELGLGESDVLFLFVGAIRPEKGIDHLARAFARLSEDYPQACLAIAGGSRLWLEGGWLSGGPHDLTERLVGEILGPASSRKRAFVLGIVPPAEIGDCYAAADIFVLPSMFQETFGLVLLEALAAGLPVIAFRSGGIPELVEHRRNGLIVPQGDDDALYEAMRELMLNPELRADFGRTGETVPPNYSWESSVERLEKIYRDILTPIAESGERTLLS